MDFYKVLRETPIYIMSADERVDKDELSEKIIGNVNPHIKSKEVEKSEYEKEDSAGSFISAPIFDENLNITGEKKFLFVKAFDTSKPLDEKHQKHFELFKTGINISHLIHELGHAYASVKNHYSMENNVLTVRTGVCQMKTKFTPLGNGEYESENISVNGLYLEEGLNTNFEERTLAKYLGISLEEVKKLYGPVLTPSFYQQGLSAITEKLAKTGVKGDIETWRRYGSESALSRINSAFSQTEIYKNRDLLNKRDKSISSNANGTLVAEKNAAFNNDELSEGTKSVLAELERSFFADTSNMQPMDVLDNMLMQNYSTINKCFRLPVDTLSKLLRVAASEGVSYIAEAQQLIEEQKGIEEVSKSV